MENFVAGTQIGQIISSYKLENFEHLRQPLIQYAIRYQRNYPFDVLEQVADDLENLITKSSFSIDQIQPEILEMIEIGQGEYCLSLNEISEAFAKLTKTRILTKDIILLILKHIFTAYSYNHSVDEFLSKEDNFLQKLINI